MAISEAPRELAEARAALAAEWETYAPQTPEQIAVFYQHSKQQAPDLDAWHGTPERQAWTAELVKVAVQNQSKAIVDIGCGLGHDLAALREALPAAVLAGVEPNTAQAVGVIERLRVPVHSIVDLAPIETSDLLVCIDLLEHVPDPEGFLGAIAQRAPLGCYLFEATATHHISNPLHLRTNIGWRPQRVLDRYGWQLRGEGQGELRVRVWERTVLAAEPRAALLMCAYRNIAVPTVRGMMALQAARVPAAAIYEGPGARPDTIPWRVRIRDGDGLITRSRALLLTEWWAETADDVALMVDDDICFARQDAEFAVELCRAKRSIVCGAYPVGDGSHFALRLWDEGGPDAIQFGTDAEPINIEYGATGFMAIHRDAVDAIMSVTDWVHEDAPWAFKPVFEVGSQPHGDVHFYVSEDWWFSQKVRDLGFQIWLDPRIRLGHLKTMPLTVGNMGLIHDAIAQQ